MTVSYCNPVYPYYFADPFVWKSEGIYYAVGTGPIAPKTRAEESDFGASLVGGQNRVFPLLRSNNLVQWELVGGALIPPNFAVDQGVFWAPEVAFSNGVFYLYYSVAASGLNHQLRVAASASPAGPYQDAGPLVGGNPECPFSIDGHAFHDDDGSWYLFYARDFLDLTNECRAGTALAVQKLNTMTQLGEAHHVVLRARRDWQRFQANRSIYGGCYDWHTLEGPCVRKKLGRYFCFFSGGCFEGSGYGVDFAVADQVLGPYSDIGGETGPRVLRTVPNHVIGPGHNSIVIGPDDRTEFIVYHAWDPQLTARRMCIDPLIWTQEGPRCQGPTWTPQTIRV